ncbi:uncharacterized protein LOC111691813 [Anoplophora glabripennis]|uniref:uncharacterized protein LOC111691813 n=1 Tax=Anoplophora glabripennis TaxID=217634 RepID=UPI000C76CE69|nr:uncharacterized protein LOC111691813 [Anoplophora glabripennis]
MPKVKLFSHCAVSKCTTKYDGQISFFRFPKENRGRCVEWLKLCGRMDLIDKDCNYLYNKLRVCGKHLQDNMFQNHLKNRLLPNAKPTNFIPNVSPDIMPDICSIKESSLQEDTEQVCNLSQIAEEPVQCSSTVLNVDHTYCTFEPIASCSTSRCTPPLGPLHLEISHSSEVELSPLKSPVQTQTTQIFSNRSPRKNKLRQKIRSQREEIRKLKKVANQEEISVQQFKSLCEKFLPEKFCNLAKAQVDLKNIRPKGRRYTEEYKEFALTLYFMILGVCKE